jgi:hypothetical protein
MEVIIIAVVLVGVAVFWVNHVKTEKSKNDNALDNWTPPKTEDKPWPYGEKVAEGKIHVKSSDVAPGKSAEDRVETPAPVVTNSTPADNVPVAKVTAENKAEAVAKVKKAPAKKPAAAKKAPAKKKSV